MKNVRYAIYLPSDSEKWFDIVFTSQARAHWFAESNNLSPDEYEIRVIDEDKKIQSSAA